ncbi:MULTISPECIES: DUF262 domain-containing protein [unclassified Pseudofrankia]|uniref:DUF262 domain-containing protein n=1 Tax=unclassified Pseudofrankia TaxID=2994372 RepID=UPI0008DA781E|nr:MULTISPECIES: DUF262 domain-containing protein [unclassified Pseudofrankia]MDT3440513.1 DUF262 domain-containing protein [Pseudofrankia sp. BMG5.37]OHV47522.1 hypothetical protein BCD48_17870 [Pseudofrankia sp. BMG5.36]
MVTAAPLDRSGSESFSIPSLVQLARQGSIRVPVFQRDFSWDAGDVRDLFDSIYRGFPVGTLLFWRHKAAAGQASLGPIEILAEEDEYAYWVVDGQQRIISLAGSLAPGLGGVDERFEVYFDLETQKFVNLRKGVHAPRAIPVRDALETRSLLTWLRRHADDLAADDYDLADRLGGAIRDYRIPAYVVTGEDQEILRELFDRVNSSGKPMSRAQVFHALFASGTEPGSPASVVAALRKLKFGALDENRVVQSLLGIRGGDVSRDLRGEFGPREDPASWYDRTEQALAKAIEFLRGEGVEHLLLAPNTFPLPVLATFFFLHPEPQPWTLRLLARWLWRGWVHDFGREGGQTPVLRRAIRSVNPHKLEVDQAPDEYSAVKSLLEYAPDRPVPHLPLQNFNTRYAHSRLVLLALASLHPHGPESSPVDLAREFEEHGTEAVTEIVRNRRSYVAARSFWPRDAIPIEEVSAPSVLASHAIDEEAAAYLWAGQIEKFLDRREELIGKLVGRFLDSRVEPGALVRPSLADLIATGTAEEG